MKDRVSKGWIYGGILLMLILACSLLMDDISIVMSKNALSETREFEEKLEVSGTLLWDEGQAFYHLLPERLRKLDTSGQLLWERELKNGKVIYAGTEGVLLSRGEDLIRWDPVGFEERSIIGFMEEPRVLDNARGYYLLSGSFRGSETASAIHRDKIMWYYSPKRETILSGSIAPGGDYSVLTLLDDQARGKMAIIDGQGEVIFHREDILPLIAKALEDAVLVVAEDKAFKMDYEGNLLWEHPWDATPSRADINPQGYTAVVLKKDQGHLYSHTETKLSMLTPKGELEWTYSLDREPALVKIDEEHVYLLDDAELLILTRHGLLTSRIPGQGWESISVLDNESFIVTQGGKSKVISTLGR